MTYQEWFKQVIFLKDKIILPNGVRFDKTKWITSNGFDIDKFNKFLKHHYYNEISKNE